MSILLTFGLALVIAIHGFFYLSMLMLSRGSRSRALRMYFRSLFSTALLLLVVHISYYAWRFGSDFFPEVFYGQNWYLGLDIYAWIIACGGIYFAARGMIRGFYLMLKAGKNRN